MFCWKGEIDIWTFDMNFICTSGWGRGVSSWSSLRKVKPSICVTTIPLEISPDTRPDRVGKLSLHQVKHFHIYKQDQVFLNQVCSEMEFFAILYDALSFLWKRRTTPISTTSMLTMSKFTMGDMPKPIAYCLKWPKQIFTGNGVSQLQGRGDRGGGRWFSNCTILLSVRIDWLLIWLIENDESDNQEDVENGEDELVLLFSTTKTFLI